MPDQNKISLRPVFFSPFSSTKAISEEPITSLDLSTQASDTALDDLERTLHTAKLLSAHHLLLPGEKQTITDDDWRYPITTINDPSKETRKTLIDSHLQTFGKAIKTSLQNLKTNLLKVATEHLPKSLLS